MELVVTCLIGLSVGAITELILPRHTISELLLAVLLGVGGALVARLLWELAGVFGSAEGVGFICSLSGAVVVLLCYVVLRKPKAGS